VQTAGCPCREHTICTAPSGCARAVGGSREPAGSTRVPATVSDDLPAKHINFADLNLNRATDVALLYQRIEGAATLVCDLYSSRDLARNLRFRHCMADAIDRAVADVHAPLLTQRHAALTKRQIVPPQAMRLDP